MPNVEPLVADLDERIEKAIRDVASATLGDCNGRARQEVRQLLGQFKVEADVTEIRLYTEQGRIKASWRVQSERMHVIVVAGVCDRSEQRFTAFGCLTVAAAHRQ